MPGCAVERSEWDSAVKAALADSDRWVVQQLAVPLREFRLNEAS